MIHTKVTVPARGTLDIPHDLGCVPGIIQVTPLKSDQAPNHVVSETQMVLTNDKYKEVTFLVSSIKVIFATKEKIVLSNSLTVPVEVEVDYDKG